MKKRGKMLMAVLGLFLIFLCFSSAAFSQPLEMQQNIPNWWLIGTPLNQQGEPPISQAQPAMVTVHGAVTKVEDMRGVAGSNQMQIKTPQGDTWVVFLGPKWFVNNQRLKFNVGDLVDVKGAKYITMGQNNIVAQDVSKGDLTMKLRNADGLPSWECCIPRMPSQQAR